jgi:Kinesin motor domain
MRDDSVSTAAEVIALAAAGSKRRALRATKLNEASSRAHAVLQLRVDIELTTTSSSSDSSSGAVDDTLAVADIDTDTAAATATDGCEGTSRTVYRRAKLRYARPHTICHELALLLSFAHIHMRYISLLLHLSCLALVVPIRMDNM